MKCWIEIAPWLVVYLTSYSGQQEVLLPQLAQHPETESGQAPPYLAPRHSSKPQVACLCHSVGLSELPAVQDKKSISWGKSSIAY